MITYDKYYFLDSIKEAIGTDRYDGEYSTEYWDMEALDCDITDTTLSLKNGDVVSKGYIEFVVSYCENESFVFDEEALTLTYNEGDRILFFKLLKNTDYELMRGGEE